MVIQQIPAPTESIDRRRLKADARAAMGKAKPSAALVTLAVAVIVLVLETLVLNVQGYFTVLHQIYDALAKGMGSVSEVLQDFMNGTDESGRAIAGSFIAMVLEFLAMIIGTGYSLYILRTLRGKKTSVGDVFDAFGIFLRAIALNILRSLLIAMWGMIYTVPAMYIASAYSGQILPQIAALLLLLPAIRAMYAYSQAEFIMLDNRRLTVLACLLMSRAVMAGRKRELFIQDCTMLGHLVLCLVPVINLWQLPYIYLVRVGYYRKAANDFRARQKQAGMSILDEDAAEADKTEGSAEPEPTSEPETEPEEAPDAESAAEPKEAAVAEPVTEQEELPEAEPVTEPEELPEAEPVTEPEEISEAAPAPESKEN